MKKHGRHKTSEWNIWQAIRQRCTNPNNPDYKNYGGRGIGLCERWEEFSSFLADMGEKPDGYSIERVDLNKHYEPSNCKWIPIGEQSRNRRMNKTIVVNGEPMLMIDAAKAVGIKYATLKRRVAKGWPQEKLFQKVQPWGR